MSTVLDKLETILDGTADGSISRRRLGRLLFVIGLGLWMCGCAGCGAIPPECIKVCQPYMVWDYAGGHCYCNAHILDRSMVRP
jgi:hypothetical protein